MNNTKYVNVFQGTGRSVIPQEGGMFSKWNLLKGKAGNVSPGACLPFGSVSCAPFSGGYSSGYGNFEVNVKAPPTKFFEGDELIGFTHFTHSGSGAFGFYYNYLLVAPYIDDWSSTQRRKPYTNERAKPGYYSCRFTEEKIDCEVTVADKVAIHRYKSLENKPIKISVDVSNNGLRQENWRKPLYSSESRFRINKNGSASGYVVMQGVKIYFYATCSDPRALYTLWQDGEMLTKTEMSTKETESRFGFVLETHDTEVEFKIAFSLERETSAMAAALATHNFDITLNFAEREWEKKFTAIEIDGVTDEEKEIFYSNFYHSLVKPCAWKKESFLWQEKEAFYLDFATLWDVYKTQMPLIFALYGEVGKGIAKTLLRFGKEQGKLFNALMLTTNMNVESTQACCLGCYVLYDAYTYGLVDETQVDDLFLVAKAEIGQYREMSLSGTMEKTTKLLDVTLISAAYAELASKLGRSADEAYFTEIANRWTDAFGEDGLLKTDYPYYEGNHWNYSFRFVRDVQKRIALSGGKENLIKQLDGFFAFSEENEEINRFEGFNNETDMETPYFYHYVDRYDRVAEIAQACVTECFKSGREGLPGNNDSGGLSACYIWNFLGLFPISGQDDVFLGIPRAKNATICLSSGKTLSIERKGEGKKVQKVEWNGERVSGYTLPVAKLLQGGTLVFHIE